MSLQDCQEDNESESVIGGSPIAQSGVVASRNSTKQNCHKVKITSKGIYVLRDGEWKREGGMFSYE